MIHKAISRIEQMEQRFDRLQNAAGDDPAAIREDLEILVQYYESGQWLRDYELDEQGLLPRDLKRGVLAQDAVYDFLDRLRSEGTEETTMQVTIEALEAYLKRQYGGWANEQGLFMKLVEELGEAAEILNKRTGRKSADGADLNTELGKELADMIHYIIAIAAVNDLDLNDIILSKDRQASIKYNHDINLETFIKEAHHGK